MKCVAGIYTEEWGEEGDGAWSPIRFSPPLLFSFYELMSVHMRVAVDGPPVRPNDLFTPPISSPSIASPTVPKAVIE